MKVEVKKLNIHLLNTKARGEKAKYIHAIKNCNLKLNSFEFVGVMGPSGSGKTTLLKALYGILPENSITSGEILVDGEERSHNFWNDFAACVDQDDAVYRDFTVEYTLRQSGLFRLMKGEKFLKVENNQKSYDSRVEERLEVIIEKLEIQKCRYMKMKHVSGGERKRVMLGIELMARPKILFMDEPTADLDPLTALNVIKFIKKMSVAEKITIFCNIHTPTSQMFSTMDRAILLNEGKIIFNGRTEDTKDFFTNLGISKIEGVSYSEMLLQLCSDEFDYRNYNLDDENLHLEINSIEEIPKKIQIKKNECYIDRRINFYHVWLLMKRNFGVMFVNTRSFANKILVMGFYIGILILFAFIAGFKEPNMLEKEKRKFISSRISNGYNPGEKEIKYHLDMHVNTSDLGFTVISKSILVVSQTIYISINCYDIGWNVLLKEISSGFYSSTSLYSGYFASVSIFTLVVNTIMTILQFLIFQRPFIGASLIIYSLSVLLSIIFGLFIGALSKTKIVHSVLGGLFIVFFFLDNKIFDNFKSHIGHIISNEKISKILDTIIDIILGISPYFLSNRIIEIFYNDILSKNNDYVEDIKRITNFIKKYKYFLDDFVELDVKKWSVLFGCNMLLWILLTLFISGRILASNNRLRLQKKI